MAQSQAEQVSSLPEEERKDFFKGWTEEEFEALEYDWGFWGRPEQSPPDDDSWHIFLALAGRGWGKSRAGAEWIRKKAMENPGCKILLLGRTAADVRDVMVSAILEASPEHEKPVWKFSQRRLEWPNGSFALATSSESPDQLRGPQGHFGWADELAALKAIEDDSGATAWSNLFTAVRLGDNPQIFGTTTPKRTQLMKELVADSTNPKKRIKIVKGSTFDNTNLSDVYLEGVLARYGDSDLAKQELYGEMLLDAEGLFFTGEMIEKSTISSREVPHRLPLRFIAVDPSVAEKPQDECGIMAVGATGEIDPFKRTAYILEDYSLRASPEVWAQRVVDAAQEYKTKFVVVEGNQGRALLQSIINTIDPTLKVFLVNAHHGKYKRAEPVVVAMQQGRVKMVDLLPDLTDQMLFFDPEETKNAVDDRLDAMVWGVTAAIIDPPPGLRFPRQKVTSPARQRLPNGIGTGRSRATTSLNRRRSVRR